MLADGKATSSEKRMFNSICKAMKVDKVDKDEVINYCNDIVNGSDDYYTEAVQEISRLLEDNSTLDKSVQTEVIWNLINIGYADTNYSDPERKIVAHLTDYWKINKAVLADINDTAETILALTNQRKWIQTTNKPLEEVTQRMQELNREIRQMKKNIEIMIEEADIA